MNDLNPNDLYHAYVIEGNRATSADELFSFLANHFDMKAGHPDMFTYMVDDFGIENASDIINANIRKPARGGKKMIIASFTTISHQAQNSLLKTLEEPEHNTHIFLITESSAIFLPTIMSRVQKISGGVDNGDNNDSDSKNKIPKDLFSAHIFLSSKAPKRLEIVKTILEEKEDEHIDDSHIIAFVRDVERLAHASFAQNTGALSAFLIVDEYIRDASSSKKLLLEYLSLQLPVLQ